MFALGERKSGWTLLWWLWLFVCVYASARALGLKSKNRKGIYAPGAFLSFLFQNERERGSPLLLLWEPPRHRRAGNQFYTKRIYFFFDRKPLLCVFLSVFYDYCVVGLFFIIIISLFLRHIVYSNYSTCYPWTGISSSIVTSWWTTFTFCLNLMGSHILTFYLYGEGGICSNGHHNWSIQLMWENQRV